MAKVTSVPCPKCGGTERDACNRCRACYRIAATLRSRKLAQDPAWRKANAASVARLARDPAWLEASTAGARRRSQKATWKANTAAASKKKAKDPVWRANQKAGAQRRSAEASWRDANAKNWQDEGRRAAVRAAMQNHSEEWRRNVAAMLGIRNKKMAKDPAWLAAAIERLAGARELSIRAVATRPEVVMAALLTYADLEFEAQKRIGPYSVDFYLTDSGAVVEVDGVYWHPDGPNVDRDAALLKGGASCVNHITDKFLKSAGWL